ncbi:MAG: Ig-like domain-containing protein [archaeon]
MENMVILKNKKVLENFILLLGLVLTLTVSFVLAAHTITTSDGETSYSVDEDVGFIYNFTVNNTDTTTDANITEVNITFDSTFAFLLNSNGTSATASNFSNTTTVLTWNNTASLVENGTLEYFWFNATASTPGTYNMTITTTNASTTSTTNITITINDTTSPASIEFVSPTGVNNSNLSGSIPINVTGTDNGVIDTILIEIFNVTHDQINNSSSTSSPVFINFTGLSDGTYYVNATINDTFGNSNSTSTRNITLDSTYPLITNGTGTQVDYTNYTQTSVYFNVTVTETNEANITFRIYNSTAEVNTTTFTGGTRAINWTDLADETYTYNATVTDYAGNSNTTTTLRITVDADVPVITLIGPVDSTPISAYDFNFTFTVADYQVSNCSLIFNNAIYNILTSVNSTGGTNGMYNTSFGIGTYIWSINCTDPLNNIGNSTTNTLIITATAGGSSGSGGAGKGCTNCNPTEGELAKGYTRSLYSGATVNFKVGKTSHTFKVGDIQKTFAKVIVSSEPQEATFVPGDEKKFDVNGDWYYDLLVKLDSINFAANKATFTLTTINEEIITPQPMTTPTPQPTAKQPTVGTTTEKSPEIAVGKTSLVTAWAIIIAIVIILALIVFSYKKFGKKKSRK